jgi:hypothetical protein
MIVSGAAGGGAEGDAAVAASLSFASLAIAGCANMASVKMLPLMAIKRIARGGRAFIVDAPLEGREHFMRLRWDWFFSENKYRFRCCAA